MHAGSLKDTFAGKRVFVTGHTGFKGAWLSLWLRHLGAEVYGYALAPAQSPSFFDQLGLERELAAHHLADIRDAARVGQALGEAKPDFVFHLAAQPLVLESYREPLATYEVNVNGTLHVLEALRRLDGPCSAVFITTDKCYENREDGRRYREEEAMGGYDPYSSSKGCAELAIASWRKSFFGPESPVAVASARAGNVIGGGDWADNRIVPDAMRSLREGKPICVRNPRAVRPWQHVLEPLHGYLRLAQALAEKPREVSLRSAFNFGPSEDASQSVEALVGEILKNWPGAWEDASVPGAPHEAGLLHLAIEKAERVLGWRPVWDFSETIRQTVGWYREAERDSAGIRDFSLGQIHCFEKAAL
ncbi:CDP-glucose 4,6-dehydratase [Ruficoccus amylovorans]|uniref:CDP-glucose 4,6-dehydratase n=1 Tax=Ruficoccus amylovorans TaxID=1804625 RepID=A0A842HBK2_9BACT|nr:CDP-glucose 4,6-dehydratase [Ruficoccus amylovorans]MBC2593448.1 CDP-glucose 4,6-dehydratase [Ruficoccus amylovorans]